MREPILVLDYGTNCEGPEPFDRIKAQRSGFDSERRGSEMSELSAKPEARDMELASTRSS